ncbi:hypothetical protein H6784_01595 [Candidatus Nomurabacteria bacterium]|nr:hypothetical protein [Candidatus Kaiserbacteria bacterium]MCB9814088.1 hypothetical protein [Candidatus Nomurabacteria bacterium]
MKVTFEDSVPIPYSKKNKPAISGMASFLINNSYGFIRNENTANNILVLFSLTLIVLAVYISISILKPPPPEVIYLLDGSTTL